MRLREHRPVRPHELAEGAGRRVSCAAPEIEGERGFPRVERVGERDLHPAGIQGVLRGEIDDAVQPHCEQGMQRKGRVAGIGLPGTHVVGRREPAGLELAQHQREVGLRLQQAGRELERAAIVLADDERIALIPVAHRPYRRRRRDLHFIRVDEERDARAGCAAHDPRERLQIALEVRRRPCLVVDVRALIVVELDRDHAIAERSDFAQRPFEPALGVVQVRRVRQPRGRRIIRVRVL
ncbi:MAG TPA: hypothetical protein VN905_08895 [Candidatus Binatia bacterium]|nr:hypothetical protein [Candidatus Binatia bacterium]